MEDVAEVEVHGRRRKLDDELRVTPKMAVRIVDKYRRDLDLARRVLAETARRVRTAERQAKELEVKVKSLEAELATFERMQEQIDLAERRARIAEETMERLRIRMIGLCGLAKLDPDKVLNW